MRCYQLICLAALLPASTASAQQEHMSWTQLSLSTCGIDRFHRENPTFDGRGVVIAVLDTGVDMGVLGLTHTPLGETKVIDVQDFTGEGDVELETIVYDPQLNKFVHYDKEGSPQEYTLSNVDRYPAGTRYYFGTIKEQSVANSAVPDINDNGRENDEFGVLVIATPAATNDDAVVYIDTDADRDFDDDKPLRNYHVQYDSFQFARKEKEHQAAPLTCALNLDLREEKVYVHFDNGGHGTHVAGIAAGYRINGQDNFHGVAPGAKIISLKIGNNNLAGGATVTASKKKAFEYAARYAREHNVPVVCNLSYGIGSEQDGHSDIDTFLDDLCRANPNLIVFSSAGNAGPGLSTIGTPAAGAAVITVAALLGADSARDVMGVDMSGPQVAVFSSRGGELAKPTIAVPGYATSTVPRWNRRGDFWRGTSMASPYAAGMGALLISAAEAKYPDSEHRSSWIATALRGSSAQLAGNTALDIGSGIPNVSSAAEAYTQMVSTLQGDVLFDYKVSTPSPLAVGGEGPAAYWRCPYYPADRSQEFSIEPRFIPTHDAEAIPSFSRQYRLESDAEWCQLRQQQVYFRSEQPARVHVDYDTTKLTQPGLYVGAIRGIAEGQVGFSLVNTVVIPHRFTAENGYHVLLADEQVEGWNVDRHFIDVPPGASAMHLTLSAPEGQFSTVSPRDVFKPNGSTVGNSRFRLDTREDITEASWSLIEELEPGVWELDLQSRRPDETSHYSLEIRFSGVLADPPVISDIKHDEGKRPGGKFALTELFDSAVPIEARGLIEGYEVKFDKTLTPKEDVASRTLTFGPEIRAARIECEFSPQDFARFTDVAVNAFDTNGTAITKDGMNYRLLSILVRNPDAAAESVKCDLQVRGAFASEDPDLSAELKVKITYLFEAPVEVEVSGPDTLYPGIRQDLKFHLRQLPPQVPDDTSMVGYIKVTNSGNSEEVITIPIEKS